ncbi:MAG: M23 family metallopeptidase [Candidatus Gracilibacteria bacterium]|nr:M23 family metallopeptidase [Candidatus Gracilibacteria bacterium]
MSMSGPVLQYQTVNAEFEEEYAESALLSIDGFITKTYTPTEDSKGVKGIHEVTVESGDTLSEIAKRHGVKASDIIINNNLSQYEITHLKPGKRLKLANGLIHKVGKTEDAAGIAKLYGVSKDRILGENEIVESDIVSGMELVVVGAKRKQPVYTTPTQLSLPSFNPGSNYSIPYTETKGRLLFPTIGKYTQYFRAGHYAVDIANNTSPPIYSAESGLVEKAQCGWNGGYGCHVIINHEDGVKTLYAHMRRLDVTVGERISRGQIVGQMGATGRVYGRTGIHLHFEVIIDGIKRNPVAFF